MARFFAFLGALLMLSAQFGPLPGFVRILTLIALVSFTARAFGWQGNEGAAPRDRFR